MTKQIKIVVDEGATITEEMLKSHITVEEGYKIEGYYTDSKYKNKFDFDKEVSKDTTIYVKIVEDKKENTTNEKDDTPKTGISDYLGLSILGIVIAISSITIIRKKQN